MIEWTKLQEIDGYIRKLDILIVKFKDDLEKNTFNNGFVIDLYTNLNNVEKFIDPEFTPAKPLTQQKIINFYFGSNPSGSIIYNSINDQRKRIGGLYLKEYFLTLNNLALSEAKSVIINELNLISDRKIVLESGGLESSDWSNSLKNHLISKLEYLNIIPTTDTATGKPITKGFQTELTDMQIESLYNSLQRDYIDATPANFKAIFKNEPLPPGFIPIKRKKIFTSSLCAYFVSVLFQKDNPGDYWSIAQNCFDVKNLRQSLNNAYQFNPDQKPKGYKNIDAILNNIYTPLL